MKELSLGGFAASMAILIVSLFAEWRNWWGNGRIRDAVLFLSGAGVIVALYLGGIPPKWFDGSSSAFWRTGWMIVPALASGLYSWKSVTFLFPLGMGLALVVVNLIPHF
jgi:hypothetical protein